MIRTYDTHAHLDQVENLPSALERAVSEGVDGIVAVSMDCKSCQKNLEIKKSTSKPQVYLAMGMHWLEHIITSFPELLLVVLAIVMLLGRYTGYRLTELVRFKALAGN